MEKYGDSFLKSQKNAPLQSAGAGHPCNFVMPYKLLARANVSHALPNAVTVKRDDPIGAQSAFHCIFEAFVP